MLRLPPLRRLRAAVLLAAAAAFGPSAAHALCAAPSPDLVGRWASENAATRGVSRAELAFQCGDVVLNGVRQPTGFHTRLFGRCLPTDCAFPEVVLGSDGSGGWRGAIEQGWARRDVHLVPLDDSRLLLVMDTAFRGGGRGDYRLIEILRPEVRRPGG